MLYAFLASWERIWPDLQIFRYITLRASLAAISAFLICVILGPRIIRLLSSRGVHEDVGRSDSPALNRLHAGKKHTPTMGGLIFLLAMFGGVFLWGRLDNLYVLLVLGVSTALGAVGFVDDFIKLTSKDKPGLRARTKLAWQVLVGTAAGLVLFSVLEVRLPDPPAADRGTPVTSRDQGPPVLPVAFSDLAGEPRYSIRDDSDLGTSVFFPVFRRVRVPLGILFIGLVALVVVASSNAVNLTDGLDGLACGSLILVSGTFAIVAYVVGRTDFAGYLRLPYVPGAGELSVLCSAMVGAGMGFLWHNCHPASVFMGDTGALPLGGAIGLVAVILKQEFLLLIAGGIFVVEAASVILQVASFRLRGKRVFRIAPLHHHFQFLGWPESKVTVRFWIVGAILALISLVTLKVR
ncbi:MAG: phospho-N-acetylmuramoyl-pentapeptide-transferase [Planctomycetota bacterium]|nr:phospho-N-acetylmuramoyl-pentapeptide-transferase [Planctomycetota bacterium]